MPEPDFTALREHLEESAVPPPFATIVARRRRRTQRVVLGTAVLVTLALIGGLATVLAPRRTTNEPLHREPSPTVSALPPAAQGTPPFIDALAAVPGAVFAIVQQCTANCLGASARYRHSLARATDHGRHWTQVSDLAGIDTQAGEPLLFAADNTHLWFAIDTTIGASTDGGRTWTLTTFPGTGTGATVGPGSTAGGALWLLVNGTVVRAPGGQKPAPAPVQPGPILTGVTALGPDTAVAETGSGWYATVDGGRHWTPTPSPCPDNSGLTVGPDGTRWIVCAGQGATGQLAKSLWVSTDGGRTWQSHGDLESGGYGTGLSPVSATTAWRTGARADIYRTTDRTQWTDVAPTGASGGPMAFVAFDVRSAAYFQSSTMGDRIVEMLTEDGGKTWTMLEFDPPS